MMYNKYGIQLVATTDSKCPQLYLDKECTEYCKKAWITHHGMQELAIDWEQKVAVLLSGRYDVGIPREDTLSPYLGSHCHSALAYWSGSERLPIPLGQIKVQTPNPEYKKVLSPIILNEVLPAITAIYKMQDDKPHWGAEGKYIAKEEWLANDSSVEEIVADVVRHFDGVQIGMHTQNDTGCAVANAVAGVVAGATHVQGTINGYGERTGNCDNTVLVPNLTLKMGIETLLPEHIERLTSVSHHVAELMNMPPQHQQPYVGTSAFAHKAGLHTSAIARRPDSYEHVDPAAVGNTTRFLLGDLSGKASVELKAEQLGIELENQEMVEVVEEMKRLEHEGYHFEVADASLELMMRRASGEEFNYFEVESFRVLVERGQDRRFDTEATLRIVVDGERMITVGEGDGPVNCLLYTSPSPRDRG